MVRCMIVVYEMTPEEAEAFESWKEHQIRVGNWEQIK
jgi:hypothetical protein